MSAALAPRPFRWTREEYLRLGELGFFRSRRVERIRGEIVEMSPIHWPHSFGVNAVAEALRLAFAGRAWVNIQNPLPTSDSDPEPDVAVYPGRFRDYTDHPANPLLVVEVSVSSL